MPQQRRRLNDVVEGPIWRAKRNDRDAVKRAVDKLKLTDNYQLIDEKGQEEARKMERDKVLKERWKKGLSEEFLVHENLLKEKAKQVKQEKKEEKEREAALAFEADFSSHHNVHMTSTTIPTLVAQTLGAPVRSRLHTVIRRAERMTALTGWHDLINAGLTQEAANEAMKEFMDQVDDPQHILRPDHEYRQEFAPLGDPTIADSPPPVSSDAYTSVTDTDNLDSDIFTDGDRYETLFAEPETNEEEGEDDEEEDEKNEDDEEDEDDEEEEDEDEDEE